MGGPEATLLMLLAALLLAAAIGDMRSFIIPNRLNALIAALAPAYWLTSGVPLWPDAAIQVGLAVLIFLLFALAFRFGMMGGGDVKLAAALALWLAPRELASFLVIMSLAGGLVTLAAVARHRLADRPGKPPIPYGVAIAFAGLWMIAERYLNHFG